MKRQAHVVYQIFKNKEDLSTYNYPYCQFPPDLNEAAAFKLLQ